MKAIPLTLLLLSCALRPVGVKEPGRAFLPAWIKNHDPQYQTGNLPIALRSPLIHKDLLYLGDDSGRMNAYRLSDGFPVWQKYDGGTYHAMPVPFGGAIIYGNSEGRVFSRQARTGRINYQVDIGSAVESPALIYRGRAFFHLRNHKIFCLDAKSGKILWAYKRSVPHLTTVQGVARPVARKGKIYTGFADGTVAAFSLEEGLIQWEKNIAKESKFIDVDTAAVFFGGTLIMGSVGGKASVLRPGSGRLLRTLPYTIGRTPLIHQGRLLLGTVDGQLVQLDTSLRERSKIKLSDQAIGSMIPWKGLIAVATIGAQIHLVDLKQNKVVDSFHLGHGSSAIFGELATGGGKLAALSSRNRLYVFK